MNKRLVIAVLVVSLGMGAQVTASEFVSPGSHTQEWLASPENGSEAIDRLEEELKKYRCPLPLAESFGFGVELDVGDSLLKFQQYFEEKKLDSNCDAPDFCDPILVALINRYICDGAGKDRINYLLSRGADPNRKFTVHVWVGQDIDPVTKSPFSKIYQKVQTTPLEYSCFHHRCFLKCRSGRKLRQTQVAELLLHDKRVQEKVNYPLVIEFARERAKNSGLVKFLQQKYALENVWKNKNKKRFQDLKIVCSYRDKNERDADNNE